MNLRRVSWKRISAAVLVMAVLTACGSSNQSQAPGPANSGRDLQGAPRLYVHANGLQLSVSPTLYRVATTSVGFVLQPASPSNDDRRDPFTVSIQLLATPPEATGLRGRSLGSSRMLRYATTREMQGGSSGWEWTVTAYERVGDHWIQYREHKLSEREPDELWGIARSLRYLPSS